MEIVQMHQILVLAARVLLGVFVAMILLVVSRKMWRERQERLEQSRRVVLEPLVLAFAHGHGESLREALEGEPDARDLWVLERILLDNLERVQGIERERLGRALDELGFVERYLAGLSHSHWWRRADAAEKLGLARSDRASAPLAAALGDDSSDVRMRAAKALGRLGGRASIRSLVGALQEPNRWSTIRIADILIETGREVVDELVASFPDLDRPARLAALDILGRVREIHVAPWLRDRLQDRDLDVRARACHALGSIGDPEAGPALAAALTDAAWPVRAMAAQAIGRLHYDEAVPALCNSIRDREWWVRANAGAALGRLGKKGEAALQLMVDDDDPYAGQQAVFRLEERGLVEAQVEALSLPGGRRRRIAESFIRRLVEAGRDGRLRELARRHANPRVRDALDHLLRGEATS